MVDTSMTCPRELYIKENKLYQQPEKELRNLRQSQHIGKVWLMMRRH